MAVKTGDVATPEEFVVAVLRPVNVPLAPAGGGVKVTVTPGTGLKKASVTVATKGLPKGCVVAAFWPLPLVAEICVAVPGVLVSEKITAAPRALALTEYVPATLLATGTGETAWPLGPVGTITDAPPLNVALGPEAGALKVTGTPGTPTPLAVTVATRAEPKEVLTTAFCIDPPVAAIEEPTTTLAVVGKMLGTSTLPVITVAPLAITLTGKPALTKPGWISTLAGTVATAVLLEAKLTVKPCCVAGPDKTTYMTWVPAPLTIKFDGVSARVSLT